MSDLRPKHTKIALDGNEYGLLFSINVIDDIQDHFDISIAQLPELLKDERKVYKVLKYLLASLINEAMDDNESGQPHVDANWIGRKLTPANISTLTSGALTALSAGMTQAADEDDEAPNATSGQQTS